MSRIAIFSSCPRFSMRQRRPSLCPCSPLWVPLQRPPPATTPTTTPATQVQRLRRRRIPGRQNGLALDSDGAAPIGATNRVRPATDYVLSGNLGARSAVADRCRTWRPPQYHVRRHRGIRSRNSLGQCGKVIEHRGAHCRDLGCKARFSSVVTSILLAARANLSGRVWTKIPSPAHLHKFRRPASMLLPRAPASPRWRHSNRTHGLPPEAPPPRSQMLRDPRPP
jgi:hypothetical protein